MIGPSSLIAKILGSHSVSLNKNANTLDFDRGTFKHITLGFERLFTSSTQECLVLTKNYKEFAYCTLHKDDLWLAVKILCAHCGIKRVAMPWSLHEHSTMGCIR